MESNHTFDKEDAVVAASWIVGGGTALFFASLVNQIAKSASNPIVRISGKIAAVGMGLIGMAAGYALVNDHVAPMIFAIMSGQCDAGSSDGEPDEQ